MGPGRGRRHLIYYNHGGPGHYVWGCTNPTRVSCPYYEQFNHELLDYPMLIAQIREKEVVPPTATQTIQMMRSEPCDDEPMVNMVVRSSTSIGQVNGKTNMEDRKSFIAISTRGSRDQFESNRDPSMLANFLETCIKLIHDNKGVTGLQEVINRCMRWGEP